MNAENARRTVAGSMRLLLLVFRNVVAAPLVSLIISYATIIGGAFLFVPLSLGFGFPGGQLGFSINCGMVGFCGVFAGAQVMSAALRRVGSIGLLILGLVYFYYYIADWGPQMSEEGTMYNPDHVSWNRLIWLGSGGLVAVVVIWWRSFIKKAPPLITASAY
jgi:hypothetical protein